MQGRMRTPKIIAKSAINGEIAIIRIVTNALVAIRNIGRSGYKLYLHPRKLYVEW